MRRIQSICALNPPHGRGDLAPLARQNHPPSATLLPRMGIYSKSGFFPILYNSYWDFQTILCRHIGIYRHDLHTNFGTLAFNNLWEIVILKKCDDFTPVDSISYTLTEIPVKNTQRHTSSISKFARRYAASFWYILSCKFYIQIWNSAETIQTKLARRHPVIIARLA